MPRPPADHDWDAVADAVETTGHAVLAGLLTAAECAAVADGWADEARFRKHVAMARHAYGEGDYRYYGEPLPDLVAALRRDFYPPLAGVAARLDRRLGRAGNYPADLDSWRARCAAAGQAKPTPLLLRYEAGGYNCLHRDLYGTVHLPLQIAVLLSLDRVKLRKPVTPGDQVLLEVVALRGTARTGSVQARALVGDKVAAEARIRFMMVDADQA